jgi:hypothetical protein
MAGFSPVIVRPRDAEEQKAGNNDMITNTFLIFAMPQANQSPDEEDTSTFILSIRILFRGSAAAPKVLQRYGAWLDENIQAHRGP